ncbi:hypothetical protein ACFE04_024047 [Oxalis oulophora]
MGFTEFMNNTLQSIINSILFKFNDDLKSSDQFVRKLRLPDYTKTFVYAIKDSQSILYILSAQNLSQRSALDAELLIKEVKPDAVVVQVKNSAVVDIQSEENNHFLGHDNDNGLVPVSAFDVLKRCFTEKVGKETYEDIAGKLVLKEIFGVSFYGHVLAAKNAAKQVGSLFLVLESSDGCRSVDNEDVSAEEMEMENGRSVVRGLVSYLIPQKVGSVVSSSTRQQFNVTEDVQLKMVKLLSSHFKSSPALKLRPLGSNLTEIQPKSDYEAPPFAQSIYSLFLDLHNIFDDLPSIGKALGHTQRMLDDVSKGQTVDSGIISEIFTFRIAVEGLRIVLNDAGRLPINKTGESEFPKLSMDEKSQALFAKALQSQAKKFKTTVAIVDASALAGIRKHWNISVPTEVENLVEEFVTSYDRDWMVTNPSDRKWLVAGKPSMVAVGVGTTAVLGASSLSKILPASTLKFLTFKAPLSLNLMLTHTQKAMAIALSKMKIIGPTYAKSSALKGGASSWKIRTVAHSVIASVEKTSFSVMRSAFYEIMRKRQVKAIGVLPLITFGCSMTSLAGLTMYGDGIECVAESLPSAFSIANLGRGVRGLQQASETVRQTDGNRIQNSVESLMYRLKNARVK